MDLNGDGTLDLLSGSYSKNDGDMAGVLYALMGDGDGFETAKPLRTEGDELLLIYTEREGVNKFADRICTKPWAADLNGDGHLDLVVGNMVGQFAFFQGRAGGEFEARSSFLTGADGQRIVVGRHSDPVLVDWDQDGDLDLLSGSESGGISLFTNVGTKTSPSFAARKMLLADFGGEAEQSGELLMPADARLDRSGTNSRIAVHDLDGDGALDIVLTDRTEVLTPVESLSFEAARTALNEWSLEIEKIRAEAPDFPANGEITDELVEHSARVQACYAKRDEIAKMRVIAGAWVLRGKVSGSHGAARDAR